MAWKYGFRLVWGLLLAASVATLVQAAVPSWSPDASKVVIPRTPARGQVHGKDLIIRAADLKQNSRLTVNGRTLKQYHLDLRSEENLFAESGVEVIFFLPQEQTLAGKTLVRVPGKKQPGTIHGVPPVHSLRANWNRGEDSGRLDENEGTLRLEFGPRKGDQQPGSIYACFSDAEKSHLVGTFVARCQ